MAATPATIEGTVTSITKPRSRRTAVPAPEKAAASPALDTLTSGATHPTDAVVQMETTALAPHPANPPHRFERGFEDLAEQIRTAGQIRTPLQVRPVAGGTYEVLSGTRRLAAARLLGMLMVPIVIHRTLDDAAALAWVLTDNLNRLDFTLSEQADLVQAQLDLGISEEAIAAAAGKKREWVKHRREIAKLAAPSRRVLDVAPETDLVQAAAIAEFADDEQLVATLTETAQDDPRQLAHQISRARHERAIAEAKAAALAPWTEAGYATVSGEYWNDPATKVLRELSATANGKALTTDQHQTCPGRSVNAVVRRDYSTAEFKLTTEVTEYCTKWKTEGHFNRHASSSSGATSGPMDDKARAKRAHLIKTNKASEAALPVRTAWIEDFFRRAKMPDDALVYAARIMSARTYHQPDHVHAWSLTHPGRTSSSHFDREAWLAIPANAVKHLVALAVGVVEKGIPKDYWRGAPEVIGVHLAQLQAWGYDLAPHEQDLVDEVKKDQARAAKAAAK